MARIIFWCYPFTNLWKTLQTAVLQYAITHSLQNHCSGRSIGKHEMSLILKQLKEDPVVKVGT